MPTTDNIEEKKKENSNNIKTNDWTKFTKNFFITFLTSICLAVVVFGSTGLYISKVAKSNILPTDVKFAPYTNTAFDVKPDSSNNKILMNVIKKRLWKGFNFWEAPENIYSQKATFIDEGFKDSWLFTFLCELEKNSKIPDGWFCSFRHFMHDNIKTDFANSFFYFQYVYSKIYELPESFVLFFYPMTFPFIAMFLCGCNFLNGLWIHLTNTPDAFKVFDGNKWEDKGLHSEVYKESWFFIRWGYSLYVLLCWFSFFIFSFILAGFMSVVGPIYAALFALSRTYKLDTNGKDTTGTDDAKGFGTFLKDIFFYKKSFIIALSAITLLQSVSRELNVNYFIGCLIAIIILAVFGMFDTSIPDPGDTTMIPIGSDVLSKNINITQKENTRKLPDCNSQNGNAGGATVETYVGAQYGEPDARVEPEQQPAPLVTPGAPVAAPAPLVDSTVAPASDVELSSREKIIQEYRRGGGRVNKPKKLKKDGTCHKKYNFNLV